MKIFTKTVLKWDGNKYIIDPVESVWYNYNGFVELACGATDAQNTLQTAQTNFYNTATQQAQQIFGSSSTVFNDLLNTFAPTIAAGPSQEGFSAGELSNLNSQAITQTGQAYKNAKEAVGDNIAAQGGGNMALPSGAAVGSDVNLASSAANQTAGELNQIQENDYQTGRQNYDTAVTGLENSTGVFNPATSSTSAATASGTAASDTANQIASQNNSWVQSVTGALGGVAGGVATGGMSNLGKGAGFFG